MHIPRLVLAGTHSGVGKTSLSTALMAAFVRRGVAVQPYKVGPDYIDPSLHTFITGRASRNLDSWLLPPGTLRRLFLRQARQKTAEEQKNSLALIEGVMGLFDGQGTGHEGSTAHVAELLAAPIVLLINGQGFSRSAAALVAGYARFSAERPLAAVLINRVASEKLYTLLKTVIEEHTGLPCLGYMPENPAFALQRRHLGLVPANETHGLAERIFRMAEAAEKTIDLAALLHLAQTAPSLEAPVSATATAPEEVSLSQPKEMHGGKPLRQGTPPPSASNDTSAPSAPLRIGIAQDAAFSFYYQDNLDLLEELGASLVFCSPLRDKRLPEDLHGLYLGGGFPEIYAAELEANASFRADVKAALEHGLPAYAECGGLLYLCASLYVPSSCTAASSGCAGEAGKNAGSGPSPSVEHRPCRSGAENSTGAAYAMTGFFPYRTEMTSCLRNFGYVQVTFERDTLLGPAGTTFRAHEFHYSRLLEDQKPEYAATVRKPSADVWPGGLVRCNTFAAYPHVHFYSEPRLAENFLRACRAFQRQSNSDSTAGTPSAENEGNASNSSPTDGQRQ